MGVLKWIVEFVLYGVIWVGILSIPVGGRPFFFQAKALVVENMVVQELDRELRSAMANLKSKIELSLLRQEDRSYQDI